MVQIYLRYEGGTFEKPNCSLVFFEDFYWCMEKKEGIFYNPPKAIGKRYPKKASARFFRGSIR